MRLPVSEPRYEDGENFCESCRQRFNVYDDGEISTALCRECAIRRFGRSDESPIDRERQREVREEYQARTGYPTGRLDPERLAQQAFEELLDALSPNVLQERFEVPYHEWRESFEPRTLRPDSIEELAAEIRRMIAHFWNGYYGAHDWPASILERGANDTMRRVFEDSHFPEYKAWDVFEERGMRDLLDLIAQHEQQRHLEFYIRDIVVERIKPLRLDSRARLAELYTDQLRSLPGAREANAASLGAIDLRVEDSSWYRVLLAHARLQITTQVT